MISSLSNQANSAALVSSAAGLGSAVGVLSRPLTCQVVPLNDTLAGHAIASEPPGQLVGSLENRALNQAVWAGRPCVDLAQVEPGVPRVLGAWHVGLYLRWQRLVGLW